MLPWERRPIEVANLLNPAFCTVLLRETAKGYESVRGSGIPYALSFLALPLVLHQATRDALPGKISVTQHTWIQAHPELRFSVEQRVTNLVPFVKEAIMFGLNLNILTIDEDGNIQTTDKKVRSPNWDRNSEPYLCFKKASFVGRWMARARDVATIYAMWGLQP
jgi:hypothetical protein